MAQFKANIIIRGKIRCETGLHIGGSKERMEIGGVDSPVIRDPQTQMPYIPGSSLKGKMRSLFEYHLGVVGVEFDKTDKTKRYGGPSTDARVRRIFGVGAADATETGPTRLIVRDCHPDQATQEKWRNMDSELNLTELKAENTINRLTSEANPRFIERVVKGSWFDFELIYTVLEVNKEEDTPKQINEDLENLMMCLRLLEHNALGKSGSRGYGKIAFFLGDPLVLGPDDYKTASEKYIAAKTEIASDKLKQLEDIATPTYPSL